MTLRSFSQPFFSRAAARLLHERRRGVGFGHLRPIYLGAYDALYPSYSALRVLRADMHVATGIIAVFVAAFCFAAASLLGVRGLM